MQETNPNFEKNGVTLSEVFDTHLIYLLLKGAAREFLPNPIVGLGGWSHYYVCAISYVKRAMIL